MANNPFSVLSSLCQHYGKAPRIQGKTMPSIMKTWGRGRGRGWVEGRAFWLNRTLLDEESSTENSSLLLYLFYQHKISSTFCSTIFCNYWDSVMSKQAIILPTRLVKSVRLTGMTPVLLLTCAQRVCPSSESQALQSPYNISFGVYFFLSSGLSP